MSRPHKPEAERRTSKIEVRTTAAEKTQIIANARDNSRDVSEYLRDLGMGVGGAGKPGRNTLPAPKRPKPSLDRELHLRQLAELGKAGSNLNQVAKVLNRREQTGEPVGSALAAVERVCLAWEKAMQDLRRILSHGH